MKTTKYKNGFTLIELMLTMGIILIVMSIIAPSIGNFKDNAFKVRSISVLGTVQQSVYHYVTDSDGMMPMLYINQKQPWINYSYGTEGRIANVLRPYLNMKKEPISGTVPATLRDPAWERYLGAKGPQDPVLGQKYRWITHHFQRPNGGIWEDMFPWGNPSSNSWEDPYAFTEIDRPSSTWAITDNDRIIQFPRTWSSLVPDPLFGDTRVTAFFDGHVKSVSISDPMFQY